MNNEFLSNIKEKLLEQKKELLLKSNRDIDIDNDGDETDEVQANMLIELANQLNNRDNAKINRIDSALQRISEKTYGLCQECGDEIPEKRLLANPYFLNCVSCVEEQEIAEKQRRKY